MKPKSQAAPPHPQTDGLSARATVVPANDITAPVNPSRGKPAKAAVNDPVPKVAGYQIDPLALVLPPGTEAELAALVDSIAKIGQIHPAVLLDNKILDGRDRAVACERLGIPLRTVSLGHCEDPVAYVIAANLPRRQLNATQRALVAVKFMPHYATEAAKRKRALSGTRANPDGTQPQVPESLPEPAACGDARDQAAKATGANPRYVSDMLKLQLEAPELFKAVDAGEISIPTALKKLAAQRDNRTAPETGSTRDAFLAVLCDDEASPTTRTAEKFYGAKTSPNIAFFRFLAVGATKILPGSQHGLTQVALFAVPVESSLTIKDKNGRSFCKASCRFLSLSIRGNVPQPATVPGQLVDDGIEGVIKMIEAMFPDARKVLSSAQHEAPQGWEYVLRDKKVGADAALANEQAAAPLADVPKPPAEVPVPKAERGQAVITESTDTADAKEAAADDREKAVLAAQVPSSQMSRLKLALQNAELKLDEAEAKEKAALAALDQQMAAARENKTPQNKKETKKAEQAWEAERSKITAESEQALAAVWDARDAILRVEIKEIAKKCKTGERLPTCEVGEIVVESAVMEYYAEDGLTILERYTKRWPRYEEAEVATDCASDFGPVLVTVVKPLPTRRSTRC